MGILGKIIQKNEVSQPVGTRSKPMLGLSISAGVVKATIWELVDHTIQIIGLGVKSFSESGKETHPDYKAIADKAADAIDLACQVAEVDVKETVFAVPQSWIVNDQLLPEYDELTTKLAKNLDLDSIAYVSIPHALSYYLQYLHKTPPTAILIGSAREGAQIAYVENGKIKENKYVEWTGGNLGKNIDNGLVQFTTLSELPGTIFLYGFGDLSAAREELVKYDWLSSERLGVGKKAPTSIAIPKVIVLEEHADSLAVALVGAKDYARHHNIHGRLEIKSLEYASLNTQMPAVVTTEVPAVIPNEHVHETHSEHPTNQNAADVPFGFVMNKDITNKINESQGDAVGELSDREVDDASVNEESYQTASRVEEDLSEDSEKEESESDLRQSEDKSSQVQEPWHGKPQRSTQSSFRRNGMSLQVSGRNMRQLVYIGIIVLALLVIGGGSAAWAYWNVPQATVTVFVRPDNLEKQLALSASTSVTTASNNSIPAQKIAIELKDTRQASTSGKRTTGEVAKGSVTISNKTGASKSFSAGTELRTSNNLKFTLTEGVTIASASAQSTSDGETKTYGKATVNATAVEIGPDGNIDKNTSLAIAGFTKDDYEAVATNKFTGGSKKDIKVVSAADRTNLARDLKSDMQLKIPSLVREKVTSDDILLDNAWQIVSNVEKFNKSVNDEADTVSVETTIKVEGYYFKKSEVEKILEGIATTSVPDGYELKDNTKDIRTDFVSLAKDGTVNFNAISRVNIIPKIDSESIAKQVIGKQEEAARKTILDNNKIYDVSFEYSVRLPGPLMTLPHKAENIKVERGIR